MNPTVSKELRAILNNPATRHLIIDVWLERKRREASVVVDEWIKAYIAEQAKKAKQDAQQKSRTRLKIKRPFAFAAYVFGLVVFPICIAREIAKGDYASAGFQAVFLAMFVAYTIDEIKVERPA